MPSARDLRPSRSELALSRCGVLMPTRVVTVKVWQEVRQQS